MLFSFSVIALHNDSMNHVADLKNTRHLQEDIWNPQTEEEVKGGYVADDRVMLKTLGKEGQLLILRSET